MWGWYLWCATWDAYRWPNLGLFYPPFLPQRLKISVEHSNTVHSIAYMLVGVAHGDSTWRGVPESGIGPRKRL